MMCNVIPAKAGISSSKGATLLPEIPTCVGMMA